ncbi:MAG: hypothetical protein NVS2B7_27320 [Herpetosiphon sp.]
MDQSGWVQLLGNFENTFRAQHPGSDLAAVAGQVGAPLVVLVHGIGGEARHWSDPVGLSTGATWLFDPDAAPPPAPREISVTQSPPYKAGAVTTWCQALSNQQMSYLNWSQSDPDDRLDIAVQELVGILSAVEEQLFAPQAQDGTTDSPVPSLVLLCHSRGGLVARAALKQLGKAGVPHLQKVLTLSTPHGCSYMPKLSNDYEATLRHYLDFSFLKKQIPGWLVPPQLDAVLSLLTGNVSSSLLRTFGAPAQGVGFQELVPGSAMLRALAENEQPLPGVQYMGFGGSNPTFIKFFVEVVGWSLPGVPIASALIVNQLIRVLPEVATAYGNLAELDAGDSAVSLASSRWPAVFGATHQNLPFNHMQALVHGPVQQAVVGAIH